MDRPAVEVSVDIAAPADRIWPLVSDIALPVGISAELVAVEWTSGAGERPYVGRTFLGTNTNQYFGRWQTTATVTECEEPTVFGWTVGEVDNPNTTWRYTLVPTDGGTRVTQSVRLGTGPSGLVIAIGRMPDKEERIVARRLEEFRATMRANLEAIKQRVETVS